MSDDKISTFINKRISSLIPNSKLTRISLTCADAPETEVIYLADELECKLRPEALKQTIGQKSKSDFKVRLAKASLLVGFPLAALGIAYSIVSYPEFAKEADKMQITWALGSLRAISLPTLAIAAGFVVLGIEKSRKIGSIADFKYGGFESDEMNAKFEAFLSWGLKARPQLSFALSGERCLTLPDDIWCHPDIRVVLFGTEAQRRAVLNADKYVLSSVIINMNNWSHFLSSRAGLEKLDPSAKVDADNKPKVKEILPAPTKPLSLRQKARKKETNWCPRFEMLCSDKRYLDLYVARKFDTNTFKVERQPCHKLLVLMHAHFEDFKLFFKKEELTEDEQVRLSKLKKRVKLSLGIVGQKNISRYNQLKIKKWIALEKHIEDVDLILDEELAKEYPNLQLFIDSEETN